MTYYQSKTVCSVCDISPRMLDYWVRSGVVRPAKAWVSKKRTDFLFEYSDLVTIRLVRQLRKAGHSLQSIRKAAKQLRLLARKERQPLWLVSDGNRFYAASSNTELIRTLGSRDAGQMVMSVVALRDVEGAVADGLAADDTGEVDLNRFKKQGPRAWKARLGTR